MEQFNPILHAVVEGLQANESIDGSKLRKTKQKLH